MWNINLRFQRVFLCAILMQKMERVAQTLLIIQSKPCYIDTTSIIILALSNIFVAVTGQEARVPKVGNELKITFVLVHFPSEQSITKR